MRTLTSGLILGAGALAVALLAWTDPASALCFPASACRPPQPAPGPLIGFGLPLAGAAVVALLLVRRFRPKE